MVLLFNRDTPLHDKREMRLSRMVSYTRKLHIFVITLIVEKVEEKEREREIIIVYIFHLSILYTYVFLFIYIILDFYLQIYLYIGFDYLDFRFFFFDSFDCLLAFLVCL